MTAACLDVDKLQAPMKATHASGVNLTYEWRVEQLQKLYQMLISEREVMREAMFLDLGRDPMEAICCETKQVEREVLYALKSLKGWMKPQLVGSPAVMIPAISKVERKPLNSPGVLIISPYNYPLQLCLRPLVGVLAGGNPSVIKPSEIATNCSRVMKQMIEKYFDPGVVQVVLGDVPVTTALLEKPWAKVLFTGSCRVGSIVAQACGKTLTPTILELGGKTPVVVDESVSPSGLQSISNRIIFGKLINAGQTCISPDTLFVHESHCKALTKALVASIETQFGKDQKKGELGRIVNRQQTKRLIDLIRDAEEAPGSTIIHGGSKSCDVDTRYICPSLILNPPSGCRIMREEIFGPILPIITFTSRDEAIQRIQDMDGEPLQLYVFTESESIYTEYTNRCRSAASVRNDCMIQANSVHLPFGGLGSSGYGCYYGKYSFDAFTHCFPTVSRPIGSIWDLNGLRYHPYAGFKGKLIEEYAMDLPDIAVLHTRKLLMGMLLIGLAAIFPSISLCLKTSMADFLEVLAKILRKQCL